ncbi:MAG TPA: oligoribonuclease [Gammaproteobacteria bacterium]|nr:oligoribonuclease [Gammaproteobacteria bacterium]
MQNPNYLIWIDLEMTGLDTENDQIIEIATVITDAELGTVAEGPVIAIHQPAVVMNAMDEWNTRTHSDSGLVQRVQESRYTAAQAEAETLAFIERYVPSGESPMCGNSICQDRRFMARRMPTLEQYFHYRNLDVSTVKELVRRWEPEIADAMKKNMRHQALDDVYDSIDELKYYRQHVFTI